MDRRLVGSAFLTGALALDNGFTTPRMGYSSWNDCSSFRDAGPNGWCWDSEDHIKNVTLYMKSSGLRALGYDHINVDEGWFVKHDPTTHAMMEDFEKFPSGMKKLGDWIKGLGFIYGLYSSRGHSQCGTGTYGAEGSLGFEANDTAWMIAAGARYLKIDSCGGSQDHATAFSDYAKWRDAMEAFSPPDDPTWFSLCGWNEWFSPPDPSVHYLGGGSLGNSWRIAGDGNEWAALTNCVNQQADAAAYAGKGAWPDPDLLIGPEVYVGGQTDEQARAQFTLWSIFPTNLLISQNVLAWSDYALETYLNSELIAINQDPLMSPARRIAGGDLAFPCTTSLRKVVAVECSDQDVSQKWDWNPTTGTFSPRGLPNGHLAVEQCSAGAPVVVADKSAPGACEAASRWSFAANGTVTHTGSGLCLDVYNWAGLLQCNGGSNQKFTYQATTGQLSSGFDAVHVSAKCLSAVPPKGSCTNVWGRKLSDGYALAFVNNGPSPATVACDATCFAALNVTSATTALKVRDLWNHADLGIISAPFSFSKLVAASGTATAYKLTPVHSPDFGQDVAFVV